MKERFDVMLWYVLTISRVLTRSRSVAVSSKVINALVALRRCLNNQRDAEFYLKNQVVSKENQVVSNQLKMGVANSAFLPTRPGRSWMADGT